MMILAKTNFGVMVSMLFGVTVSLAPASEVNPKASRPLLSSNTNAVTQMINAAAWGGRHLNGYMTVSHVLMAEHSMTIRRFVRSTARGHFSRTEVYQGMDIVAAPIAIYITNASGVWLKRGQQIIAIEEEPLLIPTIPLRFVAPRLGVVYEASYILEKDVDYFGHKAARITISVPSAIIRQLRINPELLKPAFDDLSGRAQTKVRDSNDAAARELPVTYVYIINNDPPFILSWQAYSYTGTKIHDVSYQEFSTIVSLPDSLFEPVPVSALPRAVQTNGGN